MDRTKLIRIAWGLFFLASGTSCDRPQRAGPAEGAVPTRAGGDASRRGVVEAEMAGDFRAATGQAIYVPVYSQIATGDRAHPFDLAITLSVRNTDRAHPILVASVRYYDQGGQLVRDYLKKPLRVAPLASTEFFVQEKDASGGMSSSFLVEWVAERAVSDPVVEAVMIGTAGMQGISFTSPGRVISDRARPARAGGGPGPNAGP
jgi:hypothetical protein